MSFSLNDYRDMLPLRSGGMGKIYLATQNSLNRKVVIKEMSADQHSDPAMNQRFENEAKSAASIEHENIIGVYDFGVDKGSFFIAMEFVDGPNLDQLLSDPNCPKEIALMIALQAFKGLAYSHEHAIIHRDVKPSNILISKTGAVKVADFGLAYAASSPSRLTISGTVVGTPHFMAPEQISGDIKIDNRVDIWASGVLLYRILSGDYPFNGETIPALCYNIVNKKIGDVGKIDLSIPGYLAVRISQCLEKSPQKRLSSLAPLIEALQDYFFEIGVRDVTVAIAGFLAGHTTTFDIPSLRRTGRWKAVLFNRKTILLTALSGAALAFILALLFFFLYGRHETPFTGTNTLPPSDTVITQSSPPSGLKDTLKNQQADTAEKNSDLLRPSKQIKTVQHRIAARPKTVKRDNSRQERPAPAQAMNESLKKADTVQVVIKPAIPAPAQETPKVTGVLPTGAIDILSFPRADLYIDGTFQGKTPSGNPLTLPAGKHVLTLRSDGYKAYTETINLKTGELRRIKIKMEKK
jgi:serine/threonine protein kinase